MKTCLQRIFIGMAALVSVVVAALVSSSTRGQGQPADTVSGTSVSVVAAGNDVIFSIQIQNKSTVDKRIENIQTSCSCILPEDLPETIPAQSRIDVPIRIETRGKHGSQRADIIVVLAGQDSRQFSKEYFVMAKELPDIRIPEPLSRNPSNPVRLEIELPPIAVKIAKMVYDPKLCTISVVQSVGARHYLDFVPGIGLDSGQFQIPVTINTNSDVLSQQRFNIVGHLAGAIELKRASLAFGVLVAGGVQTVNAEIYSPYGKSIRVESVRVESGAPITWQILDQNTPRVTLPITMENKDASTANVLRADLLIQCIVDGNREAVRLEAYGIRG